MYQLAVNNELDHKDSALAKDMEVPSPKAPEISAAQELMNDDKDDIFQIMKLCLKDIKKLDMLAGRRVKMVMHLTAVTQYVKLHDRFCRNPHCTRPCLNASLLIACRMRKANGMYFACPIHHHKYYLLRHHCLPLTKKKVKHGQYTLLDNESILQSVRRYLVAQNLSTITPQELCCHVNKVTSAKP